MKRNYKMLSALFLTFAITVMPAVSAFENPVVMTVRAHSGRTDASGGHKDNKNASGLGSYHYHCGGNPPHLHSGGSCPYQATATSASTTSTTSAASAASTASTASTASKDMDTVKAVQDALNERGYDCGMSDGVMGEKTRSALMKFQEDNGLTVDGIIGDEVTTALEIVLP